MAGWAPGLLILEHFTLAGWAPGLVIGELLSPTGWVPGLLIVELLALAVLVLWLNVAENTGGGTWVELKFLKTCQKTSFLVDKKIERIYLVISSN